jgi:S-adenosylmethionine decarboxylase proenzyme
LPSQRESQPPLGQALGWHWLVDFYGCSCLPTDPSVLESILVFAAESAGATVVKSCFHQFSPYGLSGVVVIAESHLAAHTWPEHKAMCLDLFSCSDKILADIAIKLIAEEIGAGSIEKRKVQRGNLID